MDKLNYDIAKIFLIIKTFQVHENFYKKTLDKSEKK